MGRYYHGTISGKFVCAVQSSYDPSLFKDPELYEIPNEYYLYYVCKCLLENDNNLFCNQCYTNYEDHYDNIDESDKQDINNRINENKNSDDTKLLAYPSGYIKYQFDTSDLNYLEQKLNQIEAEIGYDIINNLDFTIKEEDNDEFEYNLDDNNSYDNNSYDNNSYDNNSEELTSDKEVLIASWCIGKQIKKAIEVVGNCEIFCEL